MSDYIADAYVNAFEIGEFALRCGLALSVETDPGALTMWGDDLRQFMDELSPGEPFGIRAVLPIPAEVGA